MRRRAGMTLVEIMVVIAIIATVTAVAVPSMYALFDLQQRTIARDLATTYRFLISEASMRNVTFRVAYNLDQYSYKIEIGDPSTLIFGDPEQAATYEKERKKKMSLFSKGAGESETPEDAAARFQDLGESAGFKTAVQLPDDTMFAWAWTPRYEQVVTPTEEDERREDDPPRIVYSHIFPSGQVEFTMIRISDVDNPDDGYTLIVEPLSGDVRIEETVVGPDDVLSWLPEEAPTIR